MLGWNARFLRAALDSLLNPVAVCRAALASNHERYVSPIRVFFLLFGLLLATSAFIAGGSVADVSTVTLAEAADLDAWAAASGASVETINATVAGWSNVLLWPISIIAASPYILLFKAFAPRITLYGHALVYLLTNNGAMLVQIALLLALAPWLEVQTNAIISTTALALVFCAILLRVFLALYSKTIIGAVMKLLAVLILTPVAMAIMGVLQFFATELILNWRFDLSLFELMRMQAGVAS